MGYVRFIPIYSLIGSFIFEAFNRASVVYMDTVLNTEFPPGPRQTCFFFFLPILLLYCGGAYVRDKIYIGVIGR